MKFVLVHGGWQGGWVWDDVSAALGESGHEVFAPTLPGLGDDGTDRAKISLADMGNSLIYEIQERQLTDFVVVGHSGGGPVAQLVADALGGEPANSVRRVVFMSAWVLRNGESINDVRPKQEVEASRAKAEQREDRSVPMDPDLFATKFMQDATDDELAEILPRLVPSPLGWFNQPIELPRFFKLAIPSSYIFLKDDRAAPRQSYEAMAARLTRPRTVECDGSHQAMLTRPHDIAAALLAATADS